MKDRSRLFKARASVDVSTETVSTSKLRREEHLDKIRTLELGQENLSAKKLHLIPEHESISYSDELHDTGYNFSNEMHIILPRPNITECSLSGQNEAGNISLDKFEQMLNKKFEPLHTNISILEENSQQCIRMLRAILQ